MKAILCGGGTAGHVTPALAIAEILKENFENTELLFIGREGGEENELVKRHGIPIKTVKISGLKRSMSPKNLGAIIRALDALYEARGIIKEFEPELVIGTGGYVCWPVLRAAKSKKIKTVIHESNAVPGLCTRMLAPGCDKVLLNFTGCETHFKKKSNLKVVGNPMRNSLLTETREGARKKLGIGQRDFLILSFGGSGGAEIINENIISLMKNYSSRVGKVKHIHACGKKYYDTIKAKYPDLCKGKNGCAIYPYIDDMPTYMRGADIIISRCGAMTLSEIATAGVVPILIPSPNVTDNHQYKNGRLFTDRGAAIMIEEEELCERSLIDAVRYLEANPDEWARMKEKLKEFTKENSRTLICSEIRKILSK